MDKLIAKQIDFGAGFWTMDRKSSGKNIDVLRGQNIPGNSRTIDRTIGLGCIVSHKSTDFRLKSYQPANRIYHLGMHFVRHLLKYKGEIRMDHKIGATYNLQWAVEVPECKRILEWFIPDCERSDAVEQALNRVVTNAAIAGVEVQLFKVKDY
jgi:hypothetical protein